MIISLRELMGTRYMYVTMAKDFKYILHTIKALNADANANANVFMPSLEAVFEAAKRKEEIVFDLKECRCTPDFNSVIEEALRTGVSFIDSNDRIREKVLREIERRHDCADVQDAVDLPVFNLREDLSTYLNSLTPGVHYVCNLANNKTTIPLLALILILRPSITVDCSAYMNQLLKYVSARVNKVNYDKYDKFYVSTPEGVIVMEKSDMFIQEQGEVDLDEIMNSYVVVPFDFGNVGLRNNPDFAHVLEDSMRIITEEQSNLPQKLTSILGGNNG